MHNAGWKVRENERAGACTFASPPAVMRQCGPAFVAQRASRQHAGSAHCLVTAVL